MVVRLDAHQTSLEPFALWSTCCEHPDDADLATTRARYFRINTSAPTSPPSVFRVLKAGSGSGSGSSSSGHCAGRKAKIEIEIHTCQTPSSAGRPRPKPKKSNSAPVILRSNIGQGDEETGVLSRTDKPVARPFAAVLNVEGIDGRVFCFPRGAVDSEFPFRPAKRGRPLHDVDGPGTSELPCKKRRLRLHLITSRLSQPFSWPATHILNRESGEDTPVLSRFLKFAAMSTKKAGHQSALVRKAAILNRVRISIRQAAALRGHTVISGMAARGNSLSHGLQVVTSSSTGARFPGRSPPCGCQIPLVWRPHTTTFHSPPPVLNPQIPRVPQDNSSDLENAVSNPTAMSCSAPPPRPTLIAKPLELPPRAEDEEDVAFPSPDLDTRYADLSDDDMDDVYADFSVIFGSGARSPENGSGGSESAGGEHFYEEYLDELDGIRWVA
ncbi:hypothetical protein AAE478_002856 [Parahypoxylon ruwenzoriense]